MASGQPECADILGVAQAASAVAPETEFPSQPDIQLPLEQDQRVDQVGAQHLDAIRLLSLHAKAMRELQRQQQRGRSGAVRRHVYGPTFEHHLWPLDRDQYLRGRGIHEGFGFQQCRLRPDPQQQFCRADGSGQLQGRKARDIGIGQLVKIESDPTAQREDLCHARAVRP